MMRFSMPMKLMAIFVVLAFGSIACSHRVTINTTPPGAKVFVDGNMIGVSPASFVEKSGFGKSYQVKVEKEGYQTHNATETQGFNTTYLVVSIICGLVSLVGFLGLLWSQTLEDQYNYTLQRA